MRLLSDRHQKIIAQARHGGGVRVEALARQFQVSEQTIRKDLHDICEAGVLRRIHGGAVLAGSIENLDYEARHHLAQGEKNLIAAAAARIIPDQCSLFINIGTTTEAVARALTDHKNLLVITNNINVANILRHSPLNEVIIAGGKVRHADGGVVGEAAVDFINQFKVDYAVIGVSAIDEDGSLLDFDLREVKVAQAIIANAKHVILVADSMKFERSAPVRIAHLSQVGSFITDRLAPEPLRLVCQNAGVHLIEAGIG
ncbi:DeoR/GlpR family DNA-binding transcription regulator [Varunaivibrio sulfuroxidans]|uniref:DeoR family transcriptional regulator n=1 Tax=Varunaivibrio sulfuroxidans TaxID=1773489 RepID=A0A4R3JDT0_9PROT|nr:DeoR/GlpR family DNA-binding transcription regulator [Varunaivibrio sulfuroxidans]TCS64002.1 DeoR family transcriptional regulator [Varunaivibrio sulfuroxidans]WES31545.1 DeoR/GlpR family DNA-binding transcription regulator [Varunaivibrio sulfuroxidans]